MCCSFFPKVAVLVLTLLIVQMNGAVSEDSHALLAFKSTITHDPQAIMRSWNDSLPFCLWSGVTCGRRHQRVTSLDLPNMGLVATLSPYLGNLSFLMYISLENNHIHGSIPPEIGNLFRLRVLSLL
uniref:Leucine-rich repeat-containing N-terminal plant-type domain-containing protein n=1 Tax=Lactuca sativa TaxID=4236 RepID=A0A9R1WJQ1_LACSA|nr:hypothetical protein LSAT_V11C200095180 [Lactuca sativa]